MSAFVFGRIILNQIEDMVNFSYFILEQSIKYKIGINLGSNIGNNIKYFFKDNLNNENEIIFALTNNPLHSTSECLFNPDGVVIYSQNIRVDDGSSLHTRMMRVEGFISKILSSNIVDVIELYINVVKNDNYITEEVKIDQFCETVMKLYARENGWIPTVKFRFIQ